jgi:demethylmenaquinone methyltransferase/2-methoxy-6-polyprenyl-1,4-benzoquinol methylase
MSHGDDERMPQFGYRRVSADQKSDLVSAVFESVATRYDVMNDVMSAGIHRVWKRFAVAAAAPRCGERIMDLAGGTGDLAAQMAPRVGCDGQVVVVDINEAMLSTGRDRLLDRGQIESLHYAICDAEALAFPDNQFDCVTMAFGLRNVTHKDRALAEIFRILKPAGRLLVLEFSKPVAPGLGPLYDWYSFNVLPSLGRWVAGDAESYRYLAESIRVHPDQEALRGMFEDVGFERCDFQNLSGGIVALHKGFKL